MRWRRRSLLDALEAEALAPLSVHPLATSGHSCSGGDPVTLVDATETETTSSPRGRLGSTAAGKARPRADSRESTTGGQDPGRSSGGLVRKHSQRARSHVRRQAQWPGRAENGRRARSHVRRRSRVEERPVGVESRPAAGSAERPAARRLEEELLLPCFTRELFLCVSIQSK
ncbi:hypothetical protein BRADI_1g68286v3 [Brachypodium distachyon]|uniref:Uncharacterized protein n=1 Tax=Brachypodium distachyon TaxID=15368 RepID=A0A2K2DTX6_BRADI|nr:hypothetical protein BRADI_1g68286v3 [Brachypodium distachyon]